MFGRFGAGFGGNDGQPRFGGNGGQRPFGNGDGFPRGPLADLLTVEEVMSLNPIQGTENNDNLIGTAVGDRISGRLGDDILTGGEGNDLIVGGGRSRFAFFMGVDPNSVTDNDVLTGDGGNDILIGGFGNDTFTGGLGEDTFVIKSGRGDGTNPSQHIITDFELGVDQLLLPASVAAEANLPTTGVAPDPNNPTSMFGLVAIDLSGVPPVIGLNDGSSITINYV